MVLKLVGRKDVPGSLVYILTSKAAYSKIVLCQTYHLTYHFFSGVKLKTFPDVWQAKSFFRQLGHLYSQNICVLSTHHNQHTGCILLMLGYTFLAPTEAP